MEITVVRQKRVSIAINAGIHRHQDMATVPQRPKHAEPIAEATELGLHRKLDIDTVLAVLKHEGLISEADALRARADARSARGKMELHPLALIANQKLTNPRDGKPLSLE